MSDIQKLATDSLKEIREAEEKVKALASKKLWIEKVENEPKSAALLYFELFDNLVKNVGNNPEDWEKIGLLLHFGANPLSVKNKDGLNPFEYFYKRNREERLSLNETSKKHDYLTHQNENRLESIAKTLYNDLQRSGFNKEQLEPLHKVQNLWHNYRRLLYKQANTRRVAFSRLLKTVALHPKDAVGADELKQRVEARLKQEENDEKQAWKEWRQWEKGDYRARIYPPTPGHARGYSPFEKGLYSVFEWEKYLLYQPLPASSQKALDDFLLTLKDEDAHLGLKVEQVLPEKRMKAYKRALRLSRSFERSR